MAATNPAPRTPAPNTARPMAAPSKGVNAPLTSPTLVRAGPLPSAAEPDASVAAAATSTAAMINWVITAPIAVSQRAALKCSGRSFLSAIADC